MIWNLDLMWLALALTVVSILAFLLSLALDALMRDEGFGPFGNMTIITTGFFLGIALANAFGVRLRDMQTAAVTGVAGAFICLFVLVALKGLLRRL